MDVPIRLLGPAQVVADRHVSPRDRVVLSALCVHPGSVVSAQALAQALWGEDPPKSWPKVVQGSVMRLRRALGATAIETSAGGYRSVLAEGTLDTVEFERLVTRGRSFQAVQEPERAASAFLQALSLWQGDPFAELVGWDPAVAEAERLQDVRRAAEEDLVLAHLDAGRAVDAAAEVRPLVAREPFRERRWALLATALYRTGRQGEALEVLRQAARTLRDELGLDPGPDLIALEHRILEHDPTLLDIPDRMGGASATCPYRGLRPFDAEDADFFFGRAAAVAEAARRLEEFPLLIVAGPSGCGKSSLVRAGLLPLLARSGHPASVVTPGPDPLAALATAVAGLRDGGVLVVDQLEEVFAHAAGADVTSRFLQRLAEVVQGDTRVVATLRADFIGGLAESPELSRLAEGGLLLLTPLADKELREAITAPAALLGLVLEPGLVDLLVQDVSDAPGGLPLLSHALAETWEHRDGTVLTVEGYRSTGGIRSAVARSAEGLYESLTVQDRDVLRSVLQRLVTPTPAGEPVAARVPTRVFSGSPEAPRVLDLLVRSRLVTSSHETATIAHEALVRAWPRLRTWLDEDVEGQRILAHLQVAADTWEGQGAPVEELYGGARLAAALEWRARSRPVLAPVEEAFLAASAAHADAERMRRERQIVEQARRNRQLRAALVAGALLLVMSVAAGVVAGLQSRHARSAAAEADVAARTAVAARLGTTAITQPAPDLALLMARQAVAVTDEPVTQGALLQSLLNAGGLLGFAHPATAAPTPVTRDQRFTPDGDRVLRQDTEGVVRLLNTSTGSAVGADLAGSADGTWAHHPVGWVDGGRTALVSRAASTANGVELVPYDTATGERAGAPQLVPGARAADFLALDRLRVSSNGQVLVSVLAREIRVWHRVDGNWRGPRTVALTGLPAALPEQDILTGITFSADGRRAAGQMITQAPPFYVGERVLWVVDTAAAALIGSVRTSRPDGSGLWQTALSPDGSQVLVGDFGDGLVRVTDAATGKTVLAIPGNSPASALAWSPDGRRVALGRVDGSREVYALDPLRRLARYSGSELVLSVGFTTAGGLVAQDILGTIARYDLAAIAPVVRAVPTERISQVATGGEVIAIGQDDGRIAVFDGSTLRPAGEPLTLGGSHDSDPTLDPSVHRRVSALAVLPDGSALVAADRVGHLRMWSLPDRRVRWSRDDVPAALLAVSPDGTMLATLGYTPADALPDGGARTTTLTIWDLPARRPILVDRFDDLPPGAPAPKPRAVSFSPDSHRFAVSFYEDLVRAYDLVGMRRVLDLPVRATSLAFTPDSSQLVGATPQTRQLTLWDAGSGKEAARAWAPRIPDWSNLAFSRDGRWLVMSHDRSVTVLDAGSLQVAVGELTLPNDGSGDAFSLAAAADGRVLVGTQTALVELDMDASHWRDASCRLAARVLSKEEWARFLPSLPYTPACM